MFRKCKSKLFLCIIFLLLLFVLLLYAILNLYYYTSILLFVQFHFYLLSINYLSIYPSIITDLDKAIWGVEYTGSATMMDSAMLRIEENLRDLTPAEQAQTTVVIMK